MANQALEALRARLIDPRRLLELHTEITGTAAGRRYNYDALNRSTVILAVAAWEGFVEDLLKHSVCYIGSRIEGEGDLPIGVRDAMLAKIFQENNWGTLTKETKSAMWSLAGSAWRASYIGHSTSKIRNLHTPNVENVKKIFSMLIGLSDFTVDWGAKRWTRDAYTTKLDAALRLRHLIAHGAIGSETVGKGRAKDAVALINRVAGWTATTVDAHLASLKTREKPLTSAAIQAAICEMERQVS